MIIRYSRILGSAPMKEDVQGEFVRYEDVQGIIFALQVIEKGETGTTQTLAAMALAGGVKR